MLYGSFRVHAKLVGDAGACAGIFACFNDTQESDIEIRTRDQQLGRAWYLDHYGGSAPEGRTVDGLTGEGGLRTRSIGRWGGVSFMWMG